MFQPAELDPSEKGMWFGTHVKPGESRSLTMMISESYSGADVTIPVHVWRGKKDGPAVSITAAVHGDEINGTGAIRHLIRERPFQLIAGTIVFVPVINMLGF